MDDANTLATSRLAGTDSRLVVAFAAARGVDGEGESESEEGASKVAGTGVRGGLSGTANVERAAPLEARTGLDRVELAARRAQFVRTEHTAELGLGGGGEPAEEQRAP